MPKAKLEFYRVSETLVCKRMVLRFRDGRLAIDSPAKPNDGGPFEPTPRRGQSAFLRQSILNLAREKVKEKFVTGGRRPSIITMIPKEEGHLPP